MHRWVRAHLPMQLGVRHGFLTSNCAALAARPSLLASVNKGA